MKFSGSLGEYEIIETEDGSLSLFSEAFNEGCHSSHGAATETRYIYIDGCEVESRKPKCFFEVGFATGLGFIETLKAHDEFLFYSTELDEELVLWAQENNKIFDSFEKVGNTYVGSKAKARAVILIGDARETIKNHKFELPFEAIYQDAFSPKRNPTLWTKEWFEDLKALSKDEVILSTYSASSRVKKALFAAGWIVEEREGFAFKRSATRGFLKGKHSDQLLKKLENPKVLPYTDSEINS
ncbi:MAG: tRNA U34 5-methylaminomethyl-2-thiouridine-forming methyltransferase MnmC [Bacteriovoracaceae bacterium]